MPVRTVAVALRAIRVGEASRLGPPAFEIDLDFDDMSNTLPPSAGGDVHEEHRGESVDVLTAEDDRMIDELSQAPPTGLSTIYFKTSITWS